MGACMSLRARWLGSCCRYSEYRRLAIVDSDRLRPRACRSHAKVRFVTNSGPRCASVWFATNVCPKRAFLCGDDYHRIGHEQCCSRFGSASCHQHGGGAGPETSAAYGAGRNDGGIDVIRLTHWLRHKPHGQGSRGLLLHRLFAHWFTHGSALAVGCQCVIFNILAYGMTRISKGTNLIAKSLM